MYVGLVYQLHFRVLLFPFLPCHDQFHQMALAFTMQLRLCFVLTVSYKCSFVDAIVYIPNTLVEQLNDKQEQ